MNGTVTAGLSPSGGRPRLRRALRPRGLQERDKTRLAANRVLADDSKQVAYSATKARCRRRHALCLAGPARGRRPEEGRLAAVGSLRGHRAPAPAGRTSSGTYVSPTDPLFTWRAVPGAVSYRFERELAGSTSNNETVTTAALAWAPTSASPTAPGSGGSRRTTRAEPAGRARRGGPSTSTGPVPPSSPSRRRERPRGRRTSSRSSASRSQRVRHVDEALRQGAAAPAHRQGDAQLRPQDGDAEPGQEPACRQVLHGRLGPAIKDGAGNSLAATAWSVRPSSLRA